MGVMRLLGQGDRIATAAFYIRERAEIMQATACDAMVDGSETRGDIYNMAWTDSLVGSGTGRSVEVVATYPSRPGVTKVDTVTTTVLCVI